MVHLFITTIKNIYIILFQMKLLHLIEKDPLYIDKSMRCLIQKKNEVYKLFKRSNDNGHLSETFSSLQGLLATSIGASEQSCYSCLSRKLTNPSPSTETLICTLIIPPLVLKHIALFINLS